jgi:glycosidase
MPFQKLEDCRDVEIFNAYRELVSEKKLLTLEQLMEGVRKLGRDNARTPMQWNAAKNGGFSAGTPWIAVNPNYVTINAASQTGDADSVFSFYKKLIRLRKEHPVIVHGNYELLLPDDDRIFAYRRAFENQQPAGSALLVICNFTGKEISDIDFSALGVGTGELLIANYAVNKTSDTRLLPYEGRAYLV